MSTASTISPARVSAPQPCRETVLDQTRAGRGRVLQHITGFNRPNALNPVRTPSAVSHALTPLGGGNWRRAIERTQTHVLALRRFISRGQRLISLFLRAFVQYPQKSDGRLFHRFSVSPVLLLPAVHAHTKAWSRQHEVPRKTVPSAGE